MSSPSLAQLGWDDHFAALLAQHGDSLTPARVTRVDRGRCDTLTAEGPVRADARRVLHLDPERTVCVGDWAALSPRPAPGPDPELVAVLPRRTAITRASADRTSRGQVLAANVDTVLVAVSLAAPLRAGRVERLLALAWGSGATPLVVLTKADLCGDLAAAEAWAWRAAPGADVVTTSASTGDGLDDLAARVTGTAVILGPSGAGKSTLVNALLGRDALDTGPVRASDGKGRHTTVHRELVPLPGGGALIDTPGLRAIGLHGADDGVEKVFADIEELAASCRFADCRHAGEPRCAVTAAVADGTLDAGRLDRYRRTTREVAWEAARTGTREAAERRRSAKALSRQQRAAYQFRERQR